MPRIATFSIVSEKMMKSFVPTRAASCTTSRFNVPPRYDAHERVQRGAYCSCRRGACKVRQSAVFSFSQSPDRSPGRYGESTRFAMISSTSCSHLVVTRESARPNPDLIARRRHHVTLAERWQKRSRAGIMRAWRELFGHREQVG